MSRNRIIIGLVIVVVLAVGGYVIFGRSSGSAAGGTEENSVDVSAPVVDVGRDIVSAEGKIVPLRHAALSFQTGGQVAEILVQEGQAVRAGDPLVRLEATELEINVRQAETGLVQANADLETAKAGLLAAQEGVNLANIGVTTAQNGVSAAELGVTAAEAQKALVQSEPLPEEIAAAEDSIAVAQATIDQAAANRDATLEIPVSQIRSAEAQVASAMAEQRVLQDQYDRLIDAGVGGTPEEQTRFALNASVAQVNAAQRTLDELNAGATAAKQRAAGSSVSLAVAQRNSAQAQLDLLLAGVKQEQVAVSDVAISQAQAAVTQAETAVVQAEAAVSQAEVAVSQAETAVAQAEAGVTRAQTTLEAAQDALNKMTLTAPFDGAVADVSVELGEVVTPSAPVLTLADFTDWLVETTDLTEMDVVAVAVGFPVEVRVDAIPDETLEGTITDIAAVSRLTGGDVTYEVTIRLEARADLPLRWGMTVFVDVNVADQ
jgi:multidrug resistance efflux pump